MFQNFKKFFDNNIYIIMVIYSFIFSSVITFGYIEYCALEERCSRTELMLIKKEQELLESLKISQKVIKELEETPLNVFANNEAITQSSFINSNTIIGLLLFLCTVGVGYLCITQSAIPSVVESSNKNLYTYQENIIKDMVSFIVQLDKNQFGNFHNFGGLLKDHVDLSKTQIELLNSKIESMLSMVNVTNNNLILINNKLTLVESKLAGAIIETNTSIGALGLTTETAGSLFS